MKKLTRYEIFQEVLRELENYLEWEEGSRELKVTSELHWAAQEKLLIAKPELILVEEEIF